MKTKTDYIEFIRKRINDLRMEHNLSEYQLSRALGRSKGYIQSISSRHALPSLEALLDICVYFEITPEEFFNPKRTDDSKATKVLCEIMDQLEKVIELMSSNLK